MTSPSTSSPRPSRSFGTAISSLVTLRMDSATLLKPVNVVWNRGTSVTNFRPASHGFSNDDLASMMPLDFTAASAGWNCFHYTLGLSTIALAVANIFLGFDIMQVSSACRFVFVGVLAGIVALAFVMELVLCVRPMDSFNADAAESRKELEEEEADKSAM